VAGPDDLPAGVHRHGRLFTAELASKHGKNLVV
jgi:hypothetical protein